MPIDRAIAEDRIEPEIGLETILRALSFRSISGSPIGVRAPMWIGEWVFDSVGKRFYIGTDTESTSGWAAV